MLFSQESRSLGVQTIPLQECRCNVVETSIYGVSQSFGGLVVQSFGLTTISLEFRRYPYKNAGATWQRRPYMASLSRLVVQSFSRLGLRLFLWSLDDTPTRMPVQRGRDVHIWRLSVVWWFSRLVVWAYDYFSGVQTIPLQECRCNMVETSIYGVSQSCLP